MYYHDGEAYYNLPSEEENTDFLLPIEEINAYGFYNALFDKPIDEIAGQFDGTDMAVYVWGSKIVIMQEEEQAQGIYRMEMEADFEQLYMEMRTFIDDTHQFTDRMTYQRVDDWVIPAQSTRIYYSELPSEIRYQITEIETYLSYQVIDGQRNEVINTHSALFEIQVNPNPAQEQITVHFSIPLDGELDIKIVDAANNVVWEQEEHFTGTEMDIDISQLESGFYTVLSTYNDETAEAHFLKEGIGQYTDPQPVEMELQVLPNPVTDAITLVFPVPINAVMHVKITDMIGITYLETEYYVLENTLLIPAMAHLPNGMYYIICTNSDGTASVRFMKQ